jgi:hypothetical protein
LGYENTLVSFISKAALLAPDICFAILPRIPDNYLSALPMDGNMMVHTDRDFCRIIPQMDFHATISSTTALEAPSLGIRNIIVDMDGEGHESLWDQCPPSETAKYVTTPEGLVEAIRTYPLMSKADIMAQNYGNIEPNYQWNIHCFATSLLTTPSILC